MAAYNLAPILNGTTIFGGNTSGSSPNLPLAAGQLFTYAAGTTTPLGAYQTPTGTIWSNPIVLDSAGRIPGLVYFPNGVAYKFIVKDSLGNTIPDATFDNLIGIGDTSTALVSEWQASGASPTYSSATVFTTTGDTTATFAVGRRVQATVTAGTVYGSVVSSSFGVSTTVTLLMDPGQALDSGLSVVNVGFLNEPHPSVPANYPYPITFANGAGRYAFYALSNLAQTSGTQVLFQNIVQQNGTAYSNSTSNYTAPITGWHYFASTATCVNTSGSAVNLIAYIYDSTSSTYLASDLQVVNNGQTVQLNLSTIAYVTAGDLIQVLVNGVLAANVVLETTTVGRITSFCGCSLT